ncbi:MAG: hypothetical protein ACI841_001778 [Planctomycetota bacterium]|jgi:hypothetical protein
MSTRIEDAVRHLRALHGILPASVVRTGVSNSCLSIEVSDSGQPRWFSFNGSLAEIHPSSDERVPLCSVVDQQALPLQVLSWRPGRRIAARLDDVNGPRFLKGLRKRRWLRAASALDLVQGSLSASDGFIVPRIVRRIPDWAAFETSWLEMDVLTIGTGSTANFNRVGRAIRLFQHEIDTESLELHDWRAELACVDKALESARSSLGVIPEGWQRLRDRLQDCEPDSGEPVAVHRDLHDGQLMVREGRVGLIDTDLLACGSSLLDVANLGAHLALRELQDPSVGRDHGVESCGRALLMGYSVGEGFERHFELRAYQATTLLRLSLLYAQRPRWSRLCLPLLRIAERCLHDVQLV